MAKQEGLWRDAMLSVADAGCPLCNRRASVLVLKLSSNIFKCASCGYIWPMNANICHDVIEEARIEMVAAARQLFDLSAEIMETVGEFDRQEYADRWNYADKMRQAYAAIVLAAGSPENYALARMHDVVDHYRQ